MRRFVAVAVFSAFAGVAIGCSTTMPSSSSAPPSAQEQSAQHPWEQAMAIVRATEADLKKGGLRAVRGHVMELEQALAGADQAFAVAQASRDPVYVLADGQAEALAALLIASATKNPETTGQQVVVVQNPYPITSFYLGIYYNEIGMHAEALQALDAGLALPAVLPGSDNGASVPLLIAERGAALTALKRYEDCLANFDRGVKIKSLTDPQRAVMQRGRGFALIELGRLDEAEQAYRDSLKSEPNNPRASAELAYIARLRAGGPRAPTELFTRMPEPAR